MLLDLRTHVDQLLATAERNAEMARDEATHAESKAENKFDTRGLEASYLAAGQAERVAALRRLVSFVHGIRGLRRGDGPIATGGVVRLSDEDDARRLLFLAPTGGGIEVPTNGDVLKLVTPAAPLGRQLLGSWVDDEITLGPARTWSVAEYAAPER